MTIQETSRVAYYSIAHELGDRQKLIYEEICKHDNITNTELSLTLNIPINGVTPRVGELRKLGLVIDDGVRTCKVTKRNVLCWRKARTTLFD